MSFIHNQYNHNIIPKDCATVVTQPSEIFNGSHFLLGNQVTVTAYHKQPVTGNETICVKQNGVQLDEKLKIKGKQSNSVRKQGPAKPRQRAEAKTNKRQIKINKPKPPAKNELKVNWKNKNNLKTSKMLNGHKMNVDQSRNRTDQPEEQRLPDRLHQGPSDSRDSPNFFDIRNIVGSNGLASNETNLPLNGSSPNKTVIETIDIADESTMQNNNLNPIIQLKSFDTLCSNNIVSTREVAGWNQNISLQKGVAIDLKMSKSSQVEGHNQPSTSGATMNNHPTFSSSFHARGQTDQRVENISVSHGINAVASFNGNHQNKQSLSRENEAASAKMDVNQSPSRPAAVKLRKESLTARTKQSPKPLTQKNENTPSNSDSNHNQNALAGVVAQLSCQTCRRWVATDELRMCGCGCVCPNCFEANPTCTVCNQEVKEDPGAARLHYRIAVVVPHPCRYAGCSHTVQPGQPHELHCSFRPFHCYQCQQPVPMNRAMEHFRTSHPEQPAPLMDKNANVTLKNFFLIATTEKRVAYCFVQDQHVTIMINKFDNQPKASFLIHAPSNDDNTKITVKFQFTLKLYTFAQEATFTSIGPGFVDIPMEVFNDWVDELCSLDLNIFVKKIRKITKGDVVRKKKKLT